MNSNTKAFGKCPLWIFIWITLLQLSLLHVSAQSLENVRVADYPEYTHICLEFSQDIRRAHVIPKQGKSPSIEIRVQRSAGSVDQSRLTISHAIKGAKVSKSGSYWILEIDTFQNVDFNRLEWHQWNDMVTVDIPYIVPLYRDYPKPVEIEAFKNKGGKIIMIDAGHGGFDSGARAGYAVKQRPRLHEKDVTLDMAHRLKKRIDRDPEFMALLSRKGDYMPVPFGLEGNSRRSYLNASLVHRIKMAQEFRASVNISLHLNAVRNPRPRGFEVWFLGDHHADSLYEYQNYDSQQLEILGIDKSTSENAIISGIKRDNYLQYSKRLAGAIAEQMKQVPGLVMRPNYMVSGRFRVLRQFNMPTILLEYLFISNPQDHAYISQIANRTRLVEATFRGLKSYFHPTEELPDYSWDEIVEAGANDASPSQSSASKPAYHTVQRGQTLSTIAKRYGLNLNEIRALNRGKIGRGDTIYIGQRLLVSSDGGSSASETTTYVVRRGDTLKEIADRFNTSIGRIRSDNSIRSSLIYPGQRLVVRPGAGADFAEAERYKVYRVRRGDSLSEIAQRFGVKVSSIRRANSISGSRIMPNQRLMIPY